MIYGIAFSAIPNLNRELKKKKYKMLINNIENWFPGDNRCHTTRNSNGHLFEIFQFFLVFISI